MRYKPNKAFCQRLRLKLSYLSYDAAWFSCTSVMGRFYSGYKACWVVGFYLLYVHRIHMWKSCSIMHKLYCATSAALFTQLRVYCKEWDKNKSVYLTIKHNMYVVEPPFQVKPLSTKRFVLYNGNIIFFLPTLCCFPFDNYTRSYVQYTSKNK